MNHTLPYMLPGVLLKQEYLDELEITAYRLAKETGISQSHATELLKGQRNITASTSIRLGRFFNQSPTFWLNIQAHYDIWQAEQLLGDQIAAIHSHRSVALVTEG